MYLEVSYTNFYVEIVEVRKSFNLIYFLTNLALI
jgi:hypothetical protein